MFSKKDIKQISDKGISLKTIEKQIENFKKGIPFINLYNAATIKDGIKTINDKELKTLPAFYLKEAKKRQILKFVPASGSATRMFNHLFYFKEKQKSNKITDNKNFDSVHKFFSELKKFSFYNDLKNSMQKNGFDIDKCISKKDFTTIIDFLLTEKGLNYSNLPKALLKFHKYNDYSRTSVEEHLVEAANYCKDKNNTAKIHFTVSKQHLKNFITHINNVKSRYEKMFNINYDIGFSVQKSSTDVIAVDLNNKPFRNPDASLLFRPGGHGALIENLNDIKADIILTKNIDNVVTDKFKPQTYLYKKIIIAYLIKIQKKTYKYLKILESSNINDNKITEILNFIKKYLFIKINPYFDNLSKNHKIKYLFDKLNRPIRICGMVENKGEPGGGPFWVKDVEGNISLQIVESSQIDFKNKKQNKIFEKSTHFNPCDFACGVRDYKGNCFDLKKYVNNSTGFVTIKSKYGKNLKAQELPGLWNGAMDRWLTIFVEVPVITFNPVKTVNDLLKKEHQSVSG